MLNENLGFKLTVEVLYSYIYDKGMTFNNIDKKYNMPSGCAKEIIDNCNIFKHCGLSFEQGSRSIPLKSIYKIARVSQDDVSILLSHPNFQMLDEKHIAKTICEDEYSRDIKNAFIKNACDARLEEIKDEKYKVKFEGLANKLETAFEFK
ncbi:MAG: hypothetical protein MJ244_03765 [Clostridia bacterium]|nr:hypothetical protein [Clostridia bacterium]